MISMAVVVALLPASALAQEYLRGHRFSPSDAPGVHNLSVVAQDWHRYPGLAVADIIFNNANNYEVRHRAARFSKTFHPAAQ
jgi:hypothetical protein